MFKLLIYLQNATTITHTKYVTVTYTTTTTYTPPLASAGALIALGFIAGVIVASIAFIIFREKFSSSGKVSGKKVKK